MAQKDIRQQIAQKGIGADMKIYRAFFINEIYGGEFSVDYYSETSMEDGINDLFFRGCQYNGYIIIETEETGDR
jgi:hypothetical protein